MDNYDLTCVVSQLRSIAGISGELRFLFENSICIDPEGPSQYKVVLELQALQNAIENLTNRYPKLVGPSVNHAFTTLKDSLLEVKKVSHRNNPKRYSEILRDFDNLELSLICSATEELLPDFDTQSIPESVSTETTDVAEQDDVSILDDSFSSEIRTNIDGNLSEPVVMLMYSLAAQDADLVLCRCESGVDTALQYAKMWCRYAKDLLAWMEKRISLEQEFAKNIVKAAEGARACITQQDKMPLQYIYTMALEQDIKNSMASKQTTELIQHRCYQALFAKRNEIDKWRREFKEQWAKEQKRMHDALTALKKARHQYIQRSEDLEKTKAAKTVTDTTGYKTVEKRRKSKDEAQSKVVDSEMLYKQCVSDARIHQEELVKVKERIISHTRKLICQGDNVLKEATVNMFYYQRQQVEPIPLGYHNLEVTCRPLEAGEPYLLYILSKQLCERPTPNFTFEEYVPLGKGPEQTKRKISNTLSYLQDSLEDSLGRHSTDGRKTGNSDSESIGGSLESLSSPAHANRRLPKAPSTSTVSSDDLEDKDTGTVMEPDFIDCPAEANGLTIRSRMPTRAALTHRLRKMKSKMVKCKHCDNYIVVNGIECETCGAAIHRKCMEVFQLECEHRKGILFGVSLSMLPRDSPSEVPFVVRQCTAEIESRALNVQGVYRVSGSKPRIQKLCQAFETQKEQVDLSDLSPHDITSVLKHFFKELPEPLLTFDLYNDFIIAGRAIQHLTEREPTAETPKTMNDIIHNLRELLNKLPSYCYHTLHHMMAHLQRVSENYEENKMSPGNLGIVFGPTLLRPLVSIDMSMVALLESSYQAVLVEFLIAHHDQVFEPQQRRGSLRPSSPTSCLPQANSRAPRPLSEETSVVQEQEASSRERPRSLENRTFKGESSEGYISDKSSSNEAVDQLSPEANERAVLAVREASGGPESLLGAQPQHSVPRQPAKYHRHPTTGTRLRNPEPRTEAWNAADGSPDSSRSSSPEPEPHSQPLDAICQPSGHSGVEACPREVVQCMLGLDPLGTATALSSTVMGSSQEASSVSQAYLNSNQCNNNNNRPILRQGGALCPSPRRRFSGEQGPSSPAQRILSGLKLRRSHSGTDEQRFV